MRAVRIWLWVGVVMVLIQVMLGGITRLTESGLSIVEWNVVMGSFPPTSDAAWQQEFEKYQQSAQFEKVNTDFTVQEFKQIFWWEFIHRLWARLIGFVFLFPFIWFLFKKYFSRDWVKKLLIVFVLGGLQGFVGWIMVASGLDGDPWVDPSKLTIHLLLALMVYVYLIWLALSWQDKNLRPKNVALFNGMRWITVFVFIQIGLGGLMAGTDAGRIYTTWPLMQGRFAPEGAFSGLLTADKLVALTPEINFIHRTFAILVTGIIVFLWWKNRSNMSRHQFQLFTTVIFLVCLQFLLGVFTLINSAQQIPVFLGVAHQTVACILLCVCIMVMYNARGKSA
jgi:cytochrome c oxidase assembly protein subunit 15